MGGADNMKIILRYLLYLGYNNISDITALVDNSDAEGLAAVIM